MTGTVWKTAIGVACFVILYVIFLSPFDRAEQRRKEVFIDKCKTYYLEGVRNWECAKAGFPTVNTRVCKQVVEGKSTRTVCNDF